MSYFFVFGDVATICLGWLSTVQCSQLKISVERFVVIMALIIGFEITDAAIIAAASSEPEATERGSSLIDRRLLYSGLKSLFLTKRE